MISLQNLYRCIDILAKLHAKANNSNDKQMILEISYIIQQELEIVADWEDKQPSIRMGTKKIELEKLLKDNIQLTKVNKALYDDNSKLVKIIQSRITDIGNEFQKIERQFTNLKEQINRL